MARTLSQVIKAVRGVLQDTSSEGGFRYPDEELLGYISESLTEMRRLRPDLFITFGLGNAIPVYTAINLTENLPVPDSCYVPVVNYVAGRAELRDDEFTNDGRASALLSGFNLALTSNGGKR